MPITKTAHLTPSRIFLLRTIEDFMVRHSKSPQQGDIEAKYHAAGWGYFMDDLTWLWQNNAIRRQSQTDKQWSLDYSAAEWLKTNEDKTAETKAEYDARTQREAEKEAENAKQRQPSGKARSMAGGNG